MRKRINPKLDAVDRDQNLFADESIYQAVWERQELPGPGAMNYSWQTLGLPQYTPIGPSVRARDAIKATASQVYYGQMGDTVGIPTTAGQIILQPLLDPAVGYVRNPPEGISPLAQLNIPAPFNTPVPTNATTLRLK